MTKKLNLKPSLTTLEFDFEARAVTFRAGDQYVHLTIEEGRLTPTNKEFLKSAATDPDSLGLRLAMAALMLHVVTWMQDPSEENKDELVDTHRAFNEVMELAPEQAVLLALENGLKVIQETLKAKRGIGKVSLVPTEVTLTKYGEQRAVKIACGEAYVVLSEVKPEGKDSKAVNAVEEHGDVSSNEHRNMKLTFMAIREPMKVYLTNPELADEAGPQLLAAAEGWNTIKAEQPEMAESLIGPLLEGSVSLNAMPVEISEAEAQAFIDRYESGEISMKELQKALGTDGPVVH